MSNIAAYLARGDLGSPDSDAQDLFVLPLSTFDNRDGCRDCGSRGRLPHYRAGGEEFGL